MKSPRLNKKRQREGQSENQYQNRICRIDCLRYNEGRLSDAGEGRTSDGYHRGRSIRMDLCGWK